MANPSQLFLLADHIKLSLLERQRAISLNLEPNTQDGQISRSLDSFREGLEAVEAKRIELVDHDDPTAESWQDQETRLREQYEDLMSQFHGVAPARKSSISEPNDPALAEDFSHAKQRPKRPAGARVPSSSFKRSTSGSGGNLAKSVRFTDSPAAGGDDDDDAADEANRAALFPYRDDPDAPPDQSHLDNQQIHAYHTRVLRDQDDQLDRLGESIGRQRELSIQIGDELDSHVALLDEVEDQVDRHQGRLDTAKNRLGYVARKAKDHVQMTIILILIIILILLIIILK
ncbi:hypothetical protein L228DRAFT_250957 [Xylona heveae TC161]|uniref:t-SNARE coiled-coil homology domain-containing protein n=1 Tax=Xylona heveae (strain CBS 132557 / TC161) TaxID=1328760 RepID=A0A164ZQ56_XYLHT|nr:hypothetical protein L228DRAFT_250957 [Xylona heveae TC161]KZF19366.1 hypothetical protein L228DRAFT_250957 [Xylona heveae TC161]